MYDVFPEPPSYHPLYDMESQRRVHDYKEMAQQLLYWCREKTALLQERSFPPTLIEMKRLLNDLNRFRNDEVPTRLRDKQKLFQIYKETNLLSSVDVCLVCYVKNGLKFKVFELKQTNFGLICRAKSTYAAIKII